MYSEIISQGASYAPGIDGTTLIFDADFVLAGAKLHLQSSTVENSDGTVTIVEKFGVDGGELKPTLTLKATREKI